jgi:hypothetical protein
MFTGPIRAAGEPDRGDIVPPAAEQTLWETPRLLGQLISGERRAGKKFLNVNGRPSKPEGGGFSGGSANRIEPFTHDKVLILSLLRAIFRAVSLQRDLKRATPHRSDHTAV